MRERDIERYLIERVEALGGMTRKLQWVGRRGAPDRVVFLGGRTVFVEVKSPSTVRTFPADERERAQQREHTRMRAAGADVWVIGTTERVEALIGVVTQ